jgi:hypothetical protein
MTERDQQRLVSHRLAMIRHAEGHSVDSNPYDLRSLHGLRCDR